MAKKKSCTTANTDPGFRTEKAARRAPAPRNRGQAH